MKMPFLLKVYQTGTHWFGGIFYRLLYRVRLIMGKEDPVRVFERAGYSKLTRPTGPLIWLHGASVGECILAMALIRELNKAQDGITFLLTSQTLTSAQMVEKWINGNTIHQYLPMDTPVAMGNFIDHWQPDLIILLESEIWPNLILSASERRIPLVLLNARMNEKSRIRWKKRKHTADYLFRQFQWIAAADTDTYDFLSATGHKNTSMIGNLKQLVTPAIPEHDPLREILLLCSSRPVWLAVSTHFGEDEIVLHAQNQILKIHPNALLILVPRHPQRSDEIAHLVTEAKLTYSQRSSGLQSQSNVWIANSIGEIPLWLEIGSIAFIAGSLNGGKGHNPLEALAASVPVLSGSNVSSFSAIYQKLVKLGAVQFCDTSTQISEAIIAHFDDPSKKQHGLQTARKWMAAEAEKLTAQVIPPLLVLLKEANNARP